MKVQHWIPAYRGMIRGEIRRQTILDCLAFNRAGVGYSAAETASADLCGARNEVLQECIEGGFDYLVMQDADVVGIAQESSPPPSMQLVASAQETGAAMVGAICELRRGRGETNVSPFKPGELYECDLIGTGFVCIDVKQVARLANEGGYEGPWFGNTYHDARQSKRDLGEDIFFCRLIRGLGGAIYADGRVATDHDGRVYHPSAFNDLREG